MKLESKCCHLSAVVHEDSKNEAQMRQVRYSFFLSIKRIKVTRNSYQLIQVNVPHSQGIAKNYTIKKLSY